MAGIVRSFGEMVSEVLRAASATTSNTNFTISVKAYLNDEYQNLCRLVDVHALRARWSIALSAATQTDSDTPLLVAAAPQDIAELRFAELRDLAETPDVHHKLTILTHQEFRDKTQGLARAWTVSTPSIIAVRDEEGARQDLQGTSVAYEALSSNSGDTTQTLTAFGYDDAANRTPLKRTITLNGTTGVSLSNFINLLTVGKDADTTGSITVRKTATPTDVVAVIAPWERTASYKVLELHPANEDALTLTIEYKRRPPILSANSDVPFFLPPGASAVMVEGAKSRALAFREDVDWQSMEAKYRELRAEYLATVHGRSAERPRLRMV